MRITVNGTSGISLPAECVVVNLAVAFDGGTRDDVAARTTRAAERVRAILDEAIADDGGRDAKLTSLRAWTNTPYDQQGVPGDPVHVAEIRGQVTIDDLSRLAELLGRLATGPGVEVGWLDWRLRDETLSQVQPEAIRSAFDDARRRAEWIAEVAGRGGVEVVSVQDGGSGQPFPVAFAARGKMDAGAGPAVELDPQDVEISVSLTVEFTAGREPAAG